MTTLSKSLENKGFTLVEIMIVVAIIGILAAIGIPSFLKSRTESRIATFINDLKKACDYAELYAMENGDYPPDKNPAQPPLGVEDYVTRLDWTASTPIGGRWDWDCHSVGITAGVTVIGDDLSQSVLVKVDRKIDDGVLTTGNFRRTGAGGYSWVIED